MRLTALLAFALAFGSCATSRTTDRPVPTDLLIRYAEGGGFTGQWFGATIAADGSVRSWSPRQPDSMSALMGTLTSSAMLAFWQTIERDSLLDRRAVGSAGNMTRTLSVSAGGKRVEVSWPSGPSPDASVQPFARLYEQCRNAVGSIQR